MGKTHSHVNLEIETAHSSLAVLKALLAEALHKDDRKKLDDLIDRATNALDKASGLLTDVRSKVADAIDML